MITHWLALFSFSLVACGTPVMVERNASAPHLPAATSAALVDAPPAGAIELGRVNVPDYRDRANDDGCKLEAREGARRKLGATLVVMVPTQGKDFTGNAISECVTIGYATVRP